jgi:hypothetical protein
VTMKNGGGGGGDDGDNENKAKIPHQKTAIM